MNMLDFVDTVMYGSGLIYARENTNYRSLYINVM